MTEELKLLKYFISDEGRHGLLVVYYTFSHVTIAGKPHQICLLLLRLCSSWNFRLGRVHFKGIVKRDFYSLLHSVAIRISRCFYGLYILG